MTNPSKRDAWRERHLRQCFGDEWCEECAFLNQEGMFFSLRDMDAYADAAIGEAVKMLTEEEKARWTIARLTSLPDLITKIKALGGEGK